MCVRARVLSIFSSECSYVHIHVLAHVHVLLGRSGDRRVTVHAGSHSWSGRLCWQPVGGAFSVDKQCWAGGSSSGRMLKIVGCLTALQRGPLPGAQCQGPSTALCGPSSARPPRTGVDYVPSTACLCIVPSLSHSIATRTTYSRPPIARPLPRPAILHLSTLHLFSLDRDQGPRDWFSYTCPVLPLGRERPCAYRHS